MNESSNSNSFFWPNCALSQLNGKKAFIACQILTTNYQFSRNQLTFKIKTWQTVYVLSDFLPCVLTYFVGVHCPDSFFFRELVCVAYFPISQPNQTRLVIKLYWRNDFQMSCIQKKVKGIQQCGLNCQILSRNYSIVFYCKILEIVACKCQG